MVGGASIVPSISTVTKDPRGSFGQEIESATVTTRTHLLTARTTGGSGLFAAHTRY